MSEAPTGDIFGMILYLLSNSIGAFAGKFDHLGQTLFSLTPDNFLFFISLLVMLIISIPAILVFLISELIGLLLFQEILGLALTGTTLIKAKFLIYVTIGIPFAYYLPKIFKKIRLRYWGVWPSAGRYEPD
jgi:hypothetical protein